jgi:hypothetical protein
MVGEGGRGIDALVATAKSVVGCDCDGNTGDRGELAAVLWGELDSMPELSSESESSLEGKATIEILASLRAADFRVYCIGPNEPLPLVVHAGGDGGGDGREEAARARLED